MAIYIDGKLQSRANVVFSLQGGGVAVESIEIIKVPNKVEYFIGETFDPAGMKIQVNFENGKSLYLKNFEDVTFEPTELLTESDTSVTVRLQWGDKIVYANQDITVYSISALPDNLNDCT